MRLSIRHFIVLWVLLLIIMCVLLYNAYGKLKPEVFISVLTEQVQRNYPGSRLQVGKVDYGLSVNFSMTLKDINLWRDERIIGSLEEIEIRLPWWLLLFEHGNAQINLKNLNIFIDEVKQDDDSRPDVSDSAPASMVSPLIKLQVPDYLAKAHFTLRVKDLAIKDFHTHRRYFTLNKLLLKEFQYGKNSAFELNLPINLSHNDTSYDSELWLFGDLTPEKDEWRLKFRGEFRTTETGEKLQLEDLIIDGKASLMPQELSVKSSLAFFVEKKEVGTGEMKANNSDMTVMLKLNDFPLSFLALFEDEITNPYLPLLVERATGTVEVQKKYKNSLIRLEGFLEFPGQFPLGQNPNTQIPGKWRLNFDGPKWETSFMSPKGEVSFFRRSAIDFNKGGVSQYVEELGFSEIDMIPAIDLVLPFEKLMTATSGTYSSSTISFKKCKLGEKNVNGVFRYGISPGQKFYVAELKEEDKTLNINFENTTSKQKIDVVAQKFPWREQYKFISKYFAAESGTIDGKLEGRWSEEWKLGEWKSSLKTTNLKNPSGEWIKFLDKFWQTFRLEVQQIPDQQWEISVRNGFFVLDSLLLEGPDPAKLTGQVDINLKKKSFLVLNYPKNKKWKPVKKELTELPLKRNDNE